MSFWGKFGKGLLAAAPIAASFIPGVGPAASGLGKILGTAGKVAGAISPVLGQAAGARAEAKRAEAGDQMSRDQINQRADIANQGLPDSRMRTGARASLAMNGPVGVNMIKPGEGRMGRTTQFTGGANGPMDPRFSELASRTLDQTLQHSLTGGDEVRGATPDPGSSGLDKALSIGAFGSGLAGALGTLQPKPKMTTPGVMMPNSGRILRNVKF